MYVVFSVSCELTGPARDQLVSVLSSASWNSPWEERFFGVSISWSAVSWYPTNTDKGLVWAQSLGVCGWSPDTARGTTTEFAGRPVSVIRQLYSRLEASVFTRTKLLSGPYNPRWWVATWSLLDCGTGINVSPLFSIKHYWRYSTLRVRHWLGFVLGRYLYLLFGWNGDMSKGSEWYLMRKVRVFRPLTRWEISTHVPQPRLDINYVCRVEGGERRET